MSDSVAQDALDRALEEKDLVLVYQPIHEARSRAIYAAEALTRQRRQNGEIREASIIMETAEDGPELFKLDRFTMQRAYTDAARWHRQAPQVRVNVNLSPREFQEGNVFERLSELLTGCGTNPRCINLEITEVSHIEDPEETARILTRVHELGISLWLDDFGTGHSTLEHLQLFPIDGLKIPANFVKDLATDTKSRSIVRGLIAIAHDMGFRVIAEGIETDAQLDHLLEWDCDYIQGFLYSRPMTIDKFEKLLQT